MALEACRPNSKETVAHCITVLYRAYRLKYPAFFQHLNSIPGVDGS